LRVGRADTKTGTVTARARAGIINRVLRTNIYLAVPPDILDNSIMKTVMLTLALPFYRLKQSKDRDLKCSTVFSSQAAVRKFKATETGLASAVQSVVQECPNWSSLNQQVNLKC
jgi:hypothetical protein